MADKGIIFSAPMVRALLDGRKTQTRRLAMPRKGLTLGELVDHGESRQVGPVIEHRVTREMLAPPAYAPGDRLYVRESCYLPPKHISDRDMRDGADTWPRVIFAEDDREGGRDMMERCQWRSTPSIHMPRWASRLWLAVSEVRVQRLQEISEADAIAEGVSSNGAPGTYKCPWGVKGIPTLATGFSNPINAYAALWNSLHTEPGTRWEDNPWIVAVTFAVHHGNIDQSPPSGDAREGV